MSVHNILVCRDAAEALTSLIEEEARRPTPGHNHISYLELVYHDLRRKFGMMPMDLPRQQLTPAEAFERSKEKFSGAYRELAGTCLKKK